MTESTSWLPRVATVVTTIVIGSTVSTLVPRYFEITEMIEMIEII